MEFFISFFFFKKKSIVLLYMKRRRLYGIYIHRILKVSSDLIISFDCFVNLLALDLTLMALTP